jgi:nitroreductase
LKIDSARVDQREKKMEFHEAVSRRRTVREFKPDQVPRESVRRGLAAGLRAPCNAHLKSWRFILLRDREKRARAVHQGLKARDIKEREEIERFIAPFVDEELKSIYRRALPVQLTMMLEAPELLVVCYKMKPLAECRGLFDLNPLASVWMCIENIMLALADEGLFGCTYTPYEAGGLKEFLEVPAGYEIAAVIPFGFPVEEPDEGIPENLDERLSIDGWGSPSVF